MDSNTDLSPQLEPTQQQPPRSFKTPVWKINLVHLLIVNVIFFLLAVVIFPLLSALAIIDFIAVFFYIIQKQPQGIVRVIWDAVLIVLGFVAVYYGVNTFLYLGIAFLLR